MNFVIFLLYHVTMEPSARPPHSSTLSRWQQTTTFIAAGLIMNVRQNQVDSAVLGYAGSK